MAREYGTSVETIASLDKVWRIWSDMSTWGDWNPNVSSMDWQGGFAEGTTGLMNTRSGMRHRMQLVEVSPGRNFVLETSVVPGARFRFNCRVEPEGSKTKVSQTVEVRGPLGPIIGGMLGPQVAKDFGTLLSNLAKKAETSKLRAAARTRNAALDRLQPIALQTCSGERPSSQRRSARRRRRTAAARRSGSGVSGGRPP